MSIFVIRLPVSESNYEQIVTLDGEDFTLRLLWNERDRHWYLTVRDSVGTDLLTGIKVVTDIPFAPHATNEDLPKGQIWFADTSGSQADPALRELGARVLMMYVDEVSC